MRCRLRTVKVKNPKLKRKTDRRDDRGNMRRQEGQSADLCSRQTYRSMQPSLGLSLVAIYALEQSRLTQEFAWQIDLSHIPDGDLPEIMVKCPNPPLGYRAPSNIKALTHSPKSTCSRICTVSRIPPQDYSGRCNRASDPASPPPSSDPNIVQYRGYHRTASSLYIVLEYCENGSLAALVRKFGRIPESLVGLYVLQVLHGLQYLHEQGVIHRDIKGSNILATKEGSIKCALFSSPPSPPFYGDGPESMSSLMLVGTCSGRLWRRDSSHR